MDPELLLNEGSALPFLAAEHAGLINSLPSVYGQVNADGLFPESGLDTPYVRIDIVDGVITALPVTPGGRPSTIAGRQSSDARIVEIPNISHEDSIMAGDLRSWLAMARRSRTPEELLVNKVEERHRINRMKFDITLEVMKMSALQGVIRDGAGDVLYDLYDLFGIQQNVVFFDLDNTNSKVPSKIEEVVGTIEDNLVDEVMSGVEIRVDKVFYDKLINHPSIEKYFQNTPAMVAVLLDQRRQQVAGQFRRSIELAGVTFKEYRSKVKLWGAESATALIGAGEGHANPVGTLDTHKTFVAPPLDVRELDGSAAGTDDLIHMTTEPMKHGMGEEWKYQANALPIWKRPKLLVKVDAAAS